MVSWSCNNILLAISLIFLFGFHLFDAKVCSNDGSNNQLLSKTFRYKLLTSKNETWKQEMMIKMSNNHDHDHMHVTPTDESAWSSLFPRRILRDQDKYRWNIMYHNIKYPDHSKDDLKKNFLKGVSLHNVRIDPNSLHGKAQLTNLEYLLMLDVDSLVWSFRKTAGLNTSGSPYFGSDSWEDPGRELRGHFVGHYMSAAAQMWASTYNDTLMKKMTDLVSNLKECQDAMGTGYLSAFSTEFFDRFEALTFVWAPYYTIHKIMAGLLDQHELAGNRDALKMVTWMAEYFYNRVQNVIATYSIQRHWESLNEETGGMNDVLYQLFSVTGDQKHLLLAHLFDKPCFLGILAMKADSLSGFHANTHIPIIVGAQMRYELTGDELYKEISTFFLDIVNSSHTFATGGTSEAELWRDPKRLADYLRTENEESCTTYNMLKVSRNLFRWTKELSYADYYERALTNGVLGIQRGREPGVMIYMLPLGHGVSKGRSSHSWGTPFSSFWCCYGTGIESFSKLGDSIYFEEDGEVPQLYVIQYISSSLNWLSRNISLIQIVDGVVSWDQNLKVKIKVVNKEGSGPATFNLRVPSWTSSNGLKASLNKEPLPLQNPGTFLSIYRNWSSADEIALQFPLLLRTESISDDRPIYSSLKAILYGPFLLAGLSMGDHDIQTGPVNSTSDWVMPIPADYNSYLVSLAQDVGGKKFFFSSQNQVIRMQDSPQAGNDTYVHATFRLILKTKFSGKDDVVGQSVILEPFDVPGKAVTYRYQDQEGLELAFQDYHDIDFKTQSAEFLVVEGLNGENGTISLQTKEDCFVYTGVKYMESDTKVAISCRNGSLSDSSFKDAASFIWNQGLRSYHPMSFVAKGLRRNYILEPIYSLRDESYNVYFNITI